MLVSTSSRVGTAARKGYEQDVSEGTGEQDASEGTGEQHVSEGTGEQHVSEGTGEQHVSEGTGEQDVSEGTREATRGQVDGEGGQVSVVSWGQVTQRWRPCREPSGITIWITIY